MLHFIDPALRVILETPTRQAPHLRNLILTKRERQILKLIAEGLTNQGMAERLGLSIRTVQNYRLGLHLKLDAKNAAMLLKKAAALNLI